MLKLGLKTTCFCVIIKITCTLKCGKFLKVNLLCHPKNNLNSRSDDALSIFQDPVEFEGKVKGTRNNCHTEVVDDEVTLRNQIQLENR